MQRKPVFSGSRRISGLYTRDDSDVYLFTGRLNGRVVTRTLAATTKTEAIREVRALQVRGDEGKPTGGITLSDLGHDWIAFLRQRVGHRDERKRYGRRTVDLYEQRLRTHVLPSLGHRDVNTLTVHDLRRLIDSMSKLSPSTCGGTLNVVSGLLRYGVKYGLLERNVARDLDRDDRPGVKRQTEPRYLAEGDLEALIANVSETFRPVVATCTFAGLRISEALGLRWRDVAFDAKTIDVNAQLGPDGDRVPLKAASSQAADVPLLPRLAAELKALKEREARRGFARVRPDSLIFQTSTGRPQSRRNALRALHAAGDAAELNEGREPVGLHDLRHSYIAIAIAAGASIAEVASLARHANAKVTLQMYAGLMDDGRKTAAAKLSAVGFGRA
jgi:integrase